MVLAYLPCSIWNLPKLGVECVSPALAGGFLITGPPGKPQCTIVNVVLFQFGFYKTNKV